MQHSADTSSKKEIQSSLTTEIKDKKRISKSEAAKTIQRAFRNYTRRKLVKKLNKEIILKFRPGDLKGRPRKSKILDLFGVQKKCVRTLQTHG